MLHPTIILPSADIAPISEYPALKIQTFEEYLGILPSLSVNLTAL